MVTVAFDGFPTLVVSLRGPLVTVRNFHVTSLSASSSSSSSSRWKQVIDPKSAQVYPRSFVSGKFRGGLQRNEA